VVGTDLGLLVLRVAVGGVILAHGLMKIGWPSPMMGMRGMTAVRAVATWFGGPTYRFWPQLFWALVSVVAEIGGGLMILGDLALLAIRAVRRSPAPEAATQS